MKARHVDHRVSLSSDGNRQGRGRCRKLSLEVLESRWLLDGLGVLSGVVFDDLDHDGVRDPGEPGLADWAVEIQHAGSTNTPIRSFENPTPDVWSEFGRFVAAIDDERILVGSHYDDVSGFPDAGAAYLYNATTGDLLRTFVSPAPADGDKFGRAVAGIGGDILIGAPLDDTVTEDSGAVYLFDGETNEALQVFVSPTGGVNDQFGRAVTAVGNKVLIGARFDDTMGDDAGAAYLFDRYSGQLLQSFFSPAPTTDAQFGYAVAAMGEDVLIGARQDETGAAGVGAVYLFDGDTGNLLQSFPNPTQSASGEATGFGRSVAAVGDDVLVGARWDDSGEDGAGAAFLFDGATGELRHVFTSPTPFEGEEFGFSVAALGDDVLVGARWDNRWDDLGDGGGAAYLFDGDTGQLMQTFANPQQGAWDAFGISVAGLDSHVLVGTQDGNAAYLFDAADTTATTQTTADGSYRFGELQSGLYQVGQIPPAGYVQTMPGYPRSYLVSIDDGQTVSDLDFGNVYDLPPMAGDDHYVVTEDGTLTVEPDQGVLANDTDPDGPSLAPTLVNAPPHGTLVLLSNGAFTYTPDPDFFGSDSFTYRADDGLAESHVATVTITVDSVNDAPASRDNGLWVLINTPRFVEAPGVLLGDVDVEGNSLTAFLVDAPSHGAVALEPDGSYMYVPNPDYAGPDSFTYRASDGLLTSAPATVHVNVSVTVPDTLRDYLRITELNYNPLPPNSAERAMGITKRDAFEYIEVRNTGSIELDLDGVEFTGAVQAEFIGYTPLGPGEYGLLVRDRNAFGARYGSKLNILGEYNGDLHNSGEQFTLEDPFDRVILDFAYADEGDWPHWADGFGSTLEIVSTDGDYMLASNWRASGRYGGSPGTEGGGLLQNVVINEVLTHSNLPQTDAIELYNTTDEEVDISGWYLSDSANDFKIFRIPEDTAIPPGGYVVFDEYDFNPERWNPGAGGFAFDSALGDDAWLLAADSAGNLTYLVDHATFGAALNGKSFGRWPSGTGDLYQMHTLTLGSENTSPRVGPIIISEVLYAPASVDSGSEMLEFVEIYNPTTAGLDLRNWRIRGGIRYDFPNSKYPEEIWFAPGEAILVVPFDPQRDTTALDLFRDYHSITEPVQIFGPFDGMLDNNGDTVRLMRADAPAWWEPDIIPHVLEDEIYYASEDPWPTTAGGDGDSLHRRGVTDWGLLPESWAGALPSPGIVDLLAGSLAITEINYHPYEPTAAERAINPGFTRGDFEFIELLNISGRTVDLTGMRLTQGIAFDFPDMILAPGERLVIVANVTAFETRYGKGTDVVGQFLGSLNKGGERITLVGSSGRPVLSFPYEDRAPWPTRADGEGSSLELAHLTSNYGEGTNWRASVEYGGSPGSAGIDPIAEVVINEVLIDYDDPLRDKIELYNTARGPIDVSGWYLSNSGGAPKKFRIPDDTVIGAHGYLVFDGADFTSPAEGSGFMLDGFHGDNVYLVKTNASDQVTHFADHIQFGAVSEGESQGRWPSGQGDFYPLLEPTLDSQAGDNTAPRVGPLVISEIMYHPRDPGDLIKANDLEYVEIFNPTDERVELATWQLGGGIEFRFADGTSLAPRESLLVVPFDPAETDTLRTFELHYQIKPWVDVVGSFSGSLSNRGDTVRLLRAGDPPADEPELIPLLLEDEVCYGQEAPWPATADGYGYSLHRAVLDQWGNAATSWAAASPSPGTVEPRVDKLAITELNYHPYDPTPIELAIDPALTSDDFEFIELVNVAGEPLDLTGMGLTEGVTFDFPAVSFASGGRMLIVKNRAAFESRYGDQQAFIVGQYAGVLSDEGERVTLVDGSGEAVLQLAFGDSEGWPERADGRGSSLEVMDLAGYYSDPDNWRASGEYGGSPGIFGQGPRTDVMVNEVLANTEYPLLDAIELFNRSALSVDVGNWYLSDSVDGLLKFQIPEGISIPPHGYVVFDERDFNPNGSWNPNAGQPSTNEFELSDSGGDVWLVEAAGNLPIRFVDHMEYGSAAQGKSFGRWPNGEGSGYPLVLPTLSRNRPELGENSPAQLTGSLIVSEVNYHPYAATDEERALGFSEDAFEFIEFQNFSPFPFDLMGFRLSDGIEFDFVGDHAVQLEPWEHLVVAKNPTAFDVRYGNGIHVVGPYNRSLSNSGERIVLADQLGEVVIEFSYEDSDEWPTWPDGDGATLELSEPGTTPPPGENRTEYLDDPMHWRASGRFGGSPGKAGAPVMGSVVINEILPASDDLFGRMDHVELFNTTDNPIDIGGWHLSDRSRDYQQFQIPQDTTIPGRSYLTFTEAEFGFPLSRDGDELWLLAAGAGSEAPWFVDGIEFGATIENESFGRWPDGEGTLYPMLSPTLGEENSGPRIGPLIISEIHYNSNELDGRDDLEFLEILNPTRDSVNLSDWRIRGGVRYNFGDNVRIDPHATLVVTSFDPADPSNADRLISFRDTFQIDPTVTLVGGYEGRLSNGGETIRLLRAISSNDFLLEDQVDYDDHAPWPIQADGRGRSLHRQGGYQWGSDPASWKPAQPTPGSVDMQLPRIVDDGDPGFGLIGSWTWLAGQGSGSGSHYSPLGSGANQATWEFPVTPGQYQVATTWHHHEHQASNAPFRIYDGGTVIDTIRVNQELAPDGFLEQGVAWENLGTFSITGSLLTVQLSNQADEHVIADAVRIVRIGELPVGPEVRVSLGGTEIIDGASDVDFGAASIGHSVIQTFTATNTGIDALHLGSIALPAGFTLASDFADTTLQRLESTTFSLRLETTMPGTFSGDVSFGTNDVDENPFSFAVIGTVSPTQIIDNDDAAFQLNGEWVWIADQGFGSGVHYSSPGIGQNTATWTFTVVPGLYQVAVTWDAREDRATNAQFSVSEGSSLLRTVHVDQRLAPDDFADQSATWETLGTFEITGNTLTVELSDQANADVIADAVRIEYIDDRSLTIEGTYADDTLVLAAGEATYTIVLNGNTQQYSAGLIDRIVFDGGSGVDSVEISGSPANEIVHAWPTSATFSRSGLDVSLTNVANVTVLGEGGNDIAHLYDSSGNDQLTATPHFAAMYGPGYYNRVSNFPEVYVEALSGGVDAASLFDSSGDDTFEANHSTVALYGEDFYRQATGFKAVHAYATAGGVDQAILEGSDDNDTVDADPDVVLMHTSDGYDSRAKYFEEVYVDAGEGDNDQLNLSGLMEIAPGEGDRRFSDPTQSVLYSFRRFENITGVDDDYEPNDDLGVAFDLSDYEAIWLGEIDGEGIQADEDWYRIGVAPSQLWLTVDAEFSHTEGNINLQIVDSSNTVWAASTSSGDNECVSTVLPSSGTWYVKAYGGDRGNAYDLRWSTQYVHPGDANLDSMTDLSDFNIWNTHKFADDTDWTTGDFNSNGATDLSDFNIWNAHKFTSAQSPPVIDPISDIYVEEGRTDVVTVTVTDPDSPTVTFKISGGDDASQFTIDPDSGQLSFINAPDYETPADADGDNQYHVQIRAVDDTGLSDTEDLVVSVTDAPDRTVTIDGTGGDDSFELTIEESIYTLVFNGDAQEFFASEIDRIVFNGEGGEDSVDIRGSATGETAHMWPNSATFHTADLEINLTNVSSVTIHGEGGNDVAYLYDSSENDQFTATPNFAAMYGPGYYNRVSNYAEVHVEAYGGGYDVANLFDSRGDDTLEADPSTTTLYGEDFHNQAKGFKSVHVYATDGGVDQAILHGSKGDDTVDADPAVVLMYASGGHAVRAKYFEEVYADAGEGDNDQLNLSDLIEIAPGDGVRRFSDSTQSVLYSFRQFETMTGLGKTYDPIALDVPCDTQDAQPADTNLDGRSDISDLNISNPYRLPLAPAPARIDAVVVGLAEEEPPISESTIANLAWLFQQANADKDSTPINGLAAQAVDRLLATLI